MIRCILLRSIGALGKCFACFKAQFLLRWHSYVLSLSVGDHSGQCWLSGFNDVGQLILGVSAGELESMRSEDEAAFRKVFQQAAGKTYNFGCRAKSDTYNDQMKVRYQIQRASPVNWVEAGKSLIEKIAAVSSLSLCALWALIKHFWTHSMASLRDGSKQLFRVFRLYIRGSACTEL